MTNPQDPLTPITDHSFASPPPKPNSQKVKNLQLILIGLGAAALLFFILTIVFALSSSNANDKLATSSADGQKAGAEAQKAADDKKFEEAQSSDTRTYTAPASAGSFSLKIPKLWSLTTTQNDGNNTISAIANPDQIDTKAERYALRFGLKNQTYTASKASLDQQTKQKASANFSGLASSPTTLSGIEGTKYTGQISSKVSNGTLILVPIRDKTYSIETDDNTVYSQVFAEILTTVKLNP